MLAGSGRLPKIAQLHDRQCNSSQAGVWLNPPKADVPDPLKMWATHWQPVNAYAVSSLITTSWIVYVWLAAREKVAERREPTGCVGIHTANDRAACDMANDRAACAAPLQKKHLCTHISTVCSEEGQIGSQCHNRKSTDWFNDCKPGKSGHRPIRGSFLRRSFAEKLTIP